MHPYCPGYVGFRFQCCHNIDFQQEPRSANCIRSASPEYRDSWRRFSCNRNSICSGCRLPRCVAIWFGWMQLVRMRKCYHWPGYYAASYSPCCREVLEDLSPNDSRCHSQTDVRNHCFALDIHWLVGYLSINWLVILCPRRHWSFMFNKVAVKRPRWYFVYHLYFCHFLSISCCFPGCIVCHYLATNVPNGKKGKKQMKRWSTTNIRDIARQKESVLDGSHNGSKFCRGLDALAIVSFYAAFGKPQSIPPLAATIPALFAKTSTVLNPIIYVIPYKRFRKGV